MNPFTIKIIPSAAIIAFCLIGCKKNEPEGILSIKTNEVEIQSEGIYMLKGTIVITGDKLIAEHGFCWSESPDPETSGKIVHLGPRSAEGSFTALISDIQPGRTYHVKAFASCDMITYYGEDKSFQTPADLIPPLIDIDHNIYHPVKIGDQIWMGENLRVTHYPDGSPVQRITERNEWFFMPWYNPAYCWYGNSGNIAVAYGNLYTWPAAMHINAKDQVKSGQIQGVCPDGWHLPDDEEWKKLEMYLGMRPEEAEAEKWRGEKEGGKLKYPDMWMTPNIGATNETRFSAIPAGWRDGAGDFGNIEKSVRFWSSSIRGDYAWMRQLDNNSSRIFRGTTGVYEGLSIRCIKN